MSFREWPLVLFTVLGQTASGLAVFLIAPLFFFPDLAANRRLAELRLAAVLIVLGLLAAAALLSLFHLGSPKRAVKALANSGASWLSREILAEVLFLGATAVLAILAWRAPTSAAATTLTVLVVAEAGAFVFSMAKVYTLPTVPVWFSGATPLSFAATAAVLGSLSATLAAGKGTSPLPAGQTGFQAGLLTASVFVLAVSFAAAILDSPGVGLFSKRARFPVAPPKRGLAAFFALRILFLGAALGLAAAAAFKSGPDDPLIRAALGAAFVSEILGRFVFYSLPAGL